MSWQGLYGADEIALQFARASRRRRLGGSFLFVGPEGIGKRSFAFALAKTLLCRRHFAKRGDPLAPPVLIDETDAERSAAETLEFFQPCGECECCRQFDWTPSSPDDAIPTHPDFHYVKKPEDKSLLPLELLIGDKNERSRSGLCFELNQTPYMGGRKIAVIDDADYFNVEGANALLKTLEEPPQNTCIILIGTTAAKQLPTIRSRCQIFRFRTLSRDDTAQILMERGLVESQEEAELVAKNASGSISEAKKALDKPLMEFGQTLMTELARERVAGVEFGARLCAFVDEAGKEAPPRRRRLQNILKQALAFYRELFAALEDSERRIPGPIGTYVRRAVERGMFEPEDALACIERTLRALEEVDRNANLPLIVEAWIYDIAAQTRRD